MKLFGIFIDLFVIFGIVYAIGYVRGYRGAELKKWASDKTGVVINFLLVFLITFLVLGITWIIGYEQDGLWASVIALLFFAVCAALTWFTVSLVKNTKK